MFETCQNVYLQSYHIKQIFNLYSLNSALANVTLVPASYQVREDGKAVDVCANVAPNLFCDSLYDFQVYLSISTGSSGFSLKI